MAVSSIINSKCLISTLSKFAFYRLLNKLRMSVSDFGGDNINQIAVIVVLYA